MLTDDIPEKLTGTCAGDCVWVPHSGAQLTRMLQVVQRLGWHYTQEPHGYGTLLTCITSPLGGSYGSYDHF